MVKTEKVKKKKKKEKGREKAKMIEEIVEQGEEGEIDDDPPKYNSLCCVFDIILNMFIITVYRKPGFFFIENFRLLKFLITLQWKREGY